MKGTEREEQNTKIKMYKRAEKREKRVKRIDESNTRKDNGVDADKDV